MSKLILHGRKTISGTHRVSGNKNAALPMIAAALLTSEPVTLRNVPEIDDVARMLDVAKSFGARITRDAAEAWCNQKAEEALDDATEETAEAEAAEAE